MGRGKGTIIEAGSAAHMRSGRDDLDRAIDDLASEAKEIFKPGPLGTRYLDHGVARAKKHPRYAVIKVLQDHDGSFHESVVGSARTRMGMLYQAGRAQQNHKTWLAKWVDTVKMMMDNEDERQRHLQAVEKPYDICAYKGGELVWSGRATGELKDLKPLGSQIPDVAGGESAPRRRVVTVGMSPDGAVLTAHEPQRRSTPVRTSRGKCKRET